jgi:CHAT domain-containing protein
VLSLALAAPLALAGCGGTVDAYLDAKRLDQEIQTLTQAGRIAEALPLAERTLAQMEVALGREHPEVIGTTTSIALLYQTQAQFERAAELHQRALALQRKVSGPRHANVADRLLDLADLHRARGQPAEALPLLREVFWTPLPGTAAEARALAAFMPDAVFLVGADATESALKKVHGPAILHIATHGFFLNDQPSREQTRGLAATPRRSVSVTERGPGPSENPLLWSGLALAGANALASGEDDGVLTALEAAALDLVGTKLVVLSACETGVGAVRGSEGVYGLRRALVMAGAESQVMSLWKVDDEATKDLMVSFYRRLAERSGRAEALRQAQLGMLGGARAHPFFWASFILIGDWTAIN